MDDQIQGDGSPLEPIPISDDEEEAPDESLGSQSASSDSEHDEDEDAPAESESPESASPERESSLFVDQPGATISPEADDAESSQPDEDDEEEEQAESEQPEGTHSPEGEPAQGQGENDHGEDEDDYGSDESEDRDDYEGIAECGGIECQKQIDMYEHRMRAKDRRNKSLKVTIKEKNARIRVLEGRITDLAQQVKRLGERPVWAARRGPRPAKQDLSPRGMSQWQSMLRRSISEDDGFAYKKAWKSSQQTLNMPVDIGKSHPDIRFVAKDGRDVQNDMSPESEDEISPERDPIIAKMPPGVQMPDAVLFCILEHLLSYEGFLCHCISRLDPHERPDSFPTRRELEPERTGIRGRFFFSRGQRTPVSLTHDTLDPNQCLAALLVSRKCAFFGIHIFYGRNTFAFSSLGEFGRAMEGWGAARVQRVQHIELTWLGGRVVRFNLPSGERQDARTRPLQWLCQMKRISSLVIHIEETNKNVIRRPHEPEGDKLYLKRKMAGKTQGRMTRSLRYVRGLDYVTLLRGLRWVRILDLDKQFLGIPRRKSAIRDKSFTIDVSRVVTQEKKPAEAEKSRPERLDLLFPFCEQRWNPEAPDFELVRVIYDEDTEFSCRENDLDYDADSQGTISSDDDDDGSDDDEDDDSSGSGSRSPPGPLRRRRPFTPAPSPSFAEEEELSESEGDLPDESQRSVSDDPDQSDFGSIAKDNDEDDADSVTTEVFRRHRLNQYLRDDSQDSSG